MMLFAVHILLLCVQLTNFTICLTRAFKSRIWWILVWGFCWGIARRVTSMMLYYEHPDVDALQLWDQLIFPLNINISFLVWLLVTTKTFYRDEWSNDMMRTVARVMNERDSEMGEHQ